MTQTKLDVDVNDSDSSARSSIYIYRAIGYHNHRPGDGWNLYINDKEVANLKGGDSVEISLKPGNKKISFGISLFGLLKSELVSKDVLTESATQYFLVLEEQSLKMMQEEEWIRRITQQRTKYDGTDPVLEETLDAIKVLPTLPVVIPLIVIGGA